LEIKHLLSLFAFVFGVLAILPNLINVANQFCQIWNNVLKNNITLERIAGVYSIISAIGSICYHIVTIVPWMLRQYRRNMNKRQAPASTL
jgi:hypothetical protein